VPQPPTGLPNDAEKPQTPDTALLSNEACRKELDDFRKARRGEHGSKANHESATIHHSTLISQGCGKTVKIGALAVCEDALATQP
jgi:hypothetical protein